MKLLFVGWDAADWKVIRPLLDKNEMPHLAGLIGQGVCGNIATIYPPLSPMLWTSIATGKRPYKHGIHGFTEPTEDGMHVRPVTNLGRTTKAFWNILNQHEKSCIVAGWWPSHPAEPIRGAMVSNHFPPNAGTNPGGAMRPGTVYPPELAAELAELRVHPVEITGGILRMFVPEAARVNQKEDRGLHDLACIVAETMSIHAAATDLMERQEWDLAAVYYSGIDHFSHRFMRDHAGKRPQGRHADPDIFSGVVANAYRYHDAMLGRLLELAGPDCAVMVLSDHGFHSDALLPDYIPVEAAGPAVEHRHFGILCVRAPGVPAGGQIYGASVLDIAPTVLHLFGLPAGGDMDGKVLINLFPGQTERPRISSWDHVPGDDGRHSPALQCDGTAAAESLQQLVDLGYIAPLQGDAAANVAWAVTESRYNLARACLDGGKLEMGAEILAELIEQDPEQGRFHLHLIECRLQQGRMDECKQRLEAFDRSCADFAPSAAEELKRRRTERADDSLKGDEKIEMRDRGILAEKANGYSIERLVLHAQVALALGKSKEDQTQAHAALARLGDMLGQSPGLDIFLARGFAAVGAYPRALDYVTRVLEADPEHWEALGLRARVNFAAKRYRAAAESAIESLALVYIQPAMHHLLGASLENLGERGEAEREYRVALAQMPGLVRAHDALARLLRRNPATALEAAQHAERSKLLRGKLSKKRRVEAEAATGVATEVVDVPAPPRTLAIWGRGGTVRPADRSTVVTIVSGLPRSGTSMMMQMLVSAGIPVYTDGWREADPDNPRGYFEHRNATRLDRDSTWIPDARGKVVKIVGPLLRCLPPGEQYRIVFMHRNMTDVVASQEAMLKRLGRRGARLSSERLAQSYASQLVRTEEWLRRAAGVDVLGVSYENVVADPAETVSRLASFLGDPFDVPRATASVAPELRRQRAGMSERLSATARTD